MGPEGSSQIYRQIKRLKPLVQEIAGNTQRTEYQWNGYNLDASRIEQLAVELGNGCHLSFALHANEFDTMIPLIKKRGGVALNNEFSVDDNALRKRIFSLREKFKPFEFIVTVRGFGYTLKPILPEVPRPS